MSGPVELIIITPVEVSAFIDGELSADERSDIAACVRDDDRAACLVAAWQWQQALLYAAFGRIIEEPTPQRLRLTVAA
jgi:anti-sigma factor RsiW